MSNVRKETISGMKWQLLQKLTMQPVQFVVSVILARLITPEEFGILSLTSVFFAVALQLQECGFGSALIREIHRTDEDINTVFWTNVVLSFLLSALLALCAPLFVEFFHQPALLWLTRASALMMFLNSTGSVHWTLYACRRDFKTPALIQTFASLIAIPLCVIAAYFGWGYWALFLQSCLSALVSLGIVWCVSPWKPSLIWSRSSFLRFFAYGSRLMLNGIIDSFFANSKSVLVGKFYSSADLGLFNRAYHVASLPSEMVNTMFGKVTFPILATIQGDTAHLLQVYSKYIRVTCMGIFFVSCLVIALAYPIIAVLYGDQWLVCAEYLQIIMWGVMSFHYGTLNNNLLLVKGHSDIVLRLGIIKKIISFILLLPALYISMKAVCWISVLFAPFGIALNSYYTGKLYQFTMRRQARDFLPYFLLSVLCCAPAYAMTYLPIHPIFQLAAGSAVAVGLYIGALVGLKDEAFRMVWEAFRRSNVCPPRFRAAE